MENLDIWIGVALGECAVAFGIYQCFKGIRICNQAIREIDARAKARAGKEGCDHCGYPDHWGEPKRMADPKTFDNPKTLEEAAYNMREILIWIRAHPDKSILEALDYPMKGILFLLEEEAAAINLHMEQYH